MAKGHLKRQFFTAVCPPEHIRQDIKAITADQNNDPATQAWEWIRPADYHVTLAVPGALDDEEAKVLIKALQKIDAKSFDLSFQSVSFFLKQQNKKRSNKNSLWVRPDNAGDNALKVLHHKIINMMRRHGVPFGAVTIAPHLTIAKTDIGDLELMREFSKTHHDVKTGTWHCDHFFLLETLSRDDPDHPCNNDRQGSRFRTIAEFKLA